MSFQRVARQIRRAAASGAQFLRSPGRAARRSSTLPEVVRAQRFAARLAAQAEGVRLRDAAEQLADASNPLRAWFAAHTEGHGVWKWLHYFDAYHRHFQKFVGRDVHVVEVGVYSGGSLQMWRQYFGEGCRISGVDIQEDCRVYENEHTRIWIGDQADRGFWRRFREGSSPFDVVIDDGGHEPEQQIVTLEETLPWLRPAGVFVCEDIHGVGNPFSAYVGALADELNARVRRPREDGLAAAATPLQRWIRSIHCYPYMVVIERSDEAAAELIAPRHGTRWQPYQ